MLTKHLISAQWWINRNHPLYTERSKIVTGRNSKIKDTLQDIRFNLKHKLLHYYKHIRRTNGSSSMTKSGEKAWKMMVSRLLVIKCTPRPDLLPSSFTTPPIINMQIPIALDRHTEQGSFTPDSEEKHDEKTGEKPKEKHIHNSCEILKSDGNLERTL